MKHVHFYFKNCLAPGFLGKCLLSMMTKIHALISMYKLLIPTCPVGYKGRKDIALWRQIRLWWSQFKVTIGNNPKGTGITSVINLIDSKWTLSTKTRREVSFISNVVISISENSKNDVGHMTVRNRPVSRAIAAALKLMSKYRREKCHLIWKSFYRGFMIPAWLSKKLAIGSASNWFNFQPFSPPRSSAGVEQKSQSSNHMVDLLESSTQP